MHESSSPTNPLFADILASRLSRRRALTGIAAAIAAATFRGQLTAATPGSAAESSLGFEEIRNRIPEAGDACAAHYRANVILRWGDPVVAGAPPFDPRKLDADAQEKQFGFNNDFIAYMPLPRGANRSDRGLLCVNHEYTTAPMMWSARAGAPTHPLKLTAAQTAVEMAAHGHSVVEIEKVDGRWRARADSAYNRRITVRTEMRLSGPAAGSPRLQTSADPDGQKVLGTLNNCAGGYTPWGTVLIAEENVHYYFSGDPSITPEARNHQRMGLGRRAFGWGRHVGRFDLAVEPNEPNRFGWVVELDPYEPTSTPIKRTALGRFKHEGATVTLNHDGRVVVYSGDDQAFEHVYKFVSRRAYDPADPNSGRDILDEGVLHVARFEADGNCHWMPLEFGSGPLTEENGFASQADVLIETRRAADLLAATRMDRPEDIETNPVTGKVYLMCTNNIARTDDDIGPANPRSRNASGHVIEIIPPAVAGKADHARDHAALESRWEIFLMAGDPRAAKSGARYHADTSADGWFHCPDNCAFDPKGRMWIATDQGIAQALTHVPDGLRACDTEGAGRALTKFFYACPVAAEMCGPCFTPDGETLFVSVQHPGEGSSFDNPTTRWPDEDEDMPPRPSVVAITKIGGGEIGS